MEVGVVIIGTTLAFAMNDWRVFAAATLAAWIMQFFKDNWLHDHIHQVNEGDNHNHGI